MNTEEKIVSLCNRLKLSYQYVDGKLYLPYDSAICIFIWMEDNAEYNNVSDFNDITNYILHM